MKKFSNKKKHTVFFLLSPCCSPCFPCSPCKQGEQGEQQGEKGEQQRKTNLEMCQRESG